MLKRLNQVCANGMDASEIASEGDEAKGSPAGHGTGERDPSGRRVLARIRAANWLRARGSPPVRGCPERRVQSECLRRAGAPGNVLLKKGEANLRKTSVGSISQLVTVDKSDLAERIGKLSAASAGAVRDGLHMLFDRYQAAVLASQAAART